MLAEKQCAKTAISPELKAKLREFVSKSQSKKHDVAYKKMLKILESINELEYPYLYAISRKARIPPMMVRYYLKKLLEGGFVKISCQIGKNKIYKVNENDEI